MNEQELNEFLKKNSQLVDSQPIDNATPVAQSPEMVEPPSTDFLPKILNKPTDFNSIVPNEGATSSEPRPDFVDSDKYIPPGSSLMVPDKQYEFRGEPRERGSMNESDRDLKNFKDVSGTTYPVNDTLPGQYVPVQSLIDSIKKPGEPISSPIKEKSIPEEEESITPKGSPLGKSPSSTEKQVSDLVKQQKNPLDILKDIYGPGAGQEDLAKAQKDAQLNRGLMGVIKGFTEIGSKGLADTKGIDKMIENSDQPVKDIIQLRAAVDEHNKQVKQVLENATLKEESNPNSDVSRIMRDMGKKLGYDFGGASAAQIKNSGIKITDLLDAKAKNDYNSILRASVMAKQKETKQEQNNKDLIGKSTGGRGAPADIVQATRDNYALEKANALLNMVPDRNNMPNDMITLLKGELAKVAQGNSPTHEGLKALDNPTIKSKLAPMISAFTNEPTPVNAKAFLDNYEKYIKDMGETANARLYKTRSQMLKTLGSGISEEHKQNYKEQLLDPIAPKAQESKIKSVNMLQLQKYAQAKGLDIDSARELFKQNGIEVQ